MNTRAEEEVLQRKADLARRRLLEVVDELDRRRHALQHPLRTVRRRVSLRSVEPVWFAAAGAATLFVVGVVGASMARRRRTRRPAVQIHEGLPPPSFGADVASRAGRALVTFALVQLGKEAWRRARQNARAGPLSASPRPSVV